MPYNNISIKLPSLIVEKKLTLPDFNTLRFMAKNDPDGLEDLRIALCNKVINEAPKHAKDRLEGLMFQINTRRNLASSEWGGDQNSSDILKEPLQRMQAMLKDLRSMQSESILLSTRHFYKTKNPPLPTANVLPFRPSKR